MYRVSSSLHSVSSPQKPQEIIRSGRNSGIDCASVSQKLFKPMPVGSKKSCLLWNLVTKIVDKRLILYPSNFRNGENSSGMAINIAIFKSKSERSLAR